MVVALLALVLVPQLSSILGSDSVDTANLPNASKVAAGTPIVGSRVDGVADAVRDGVDGLLCEPGNSAELASAIGRVIGGEADWEDLRSNAWRRQCEQFSDRGMAQRVASLYREIVCR